MINKFIDHLIEEDHTYKNIWAQHLRATGPGAKPENPLYYLAYRMSDIIEASLSSKLEDLDFDKDPFDIVCKLIERLQKFDSLSDRKIVHIVKPKLEGWLQTKLASIKEVAARSIKFETWQPVSEVTIVNLNLVRKSFTLNL